MLTVILHRRRIQRTFEIIMRVYESQALDPHVNREKFREELFDKEMNHIQKKEEEEK